MGKAFTALPSWKGNPTVYITLFGSALLVLLRIGGGRLLAFRIGFTPGLTLTLLSLIAPYMSPLPRARAFHAVPDCHNPLCSNRPISVGTASDVSKDDVIARDEHHSAVAIGP